MEIVGWVGVVLAGVSLAWQVTERLLDSSRVRVEILTAYAGNDVPPAVLNEKGQFDSEWTWGLVTSGRAIPAQVIRVRVRGRLAVTVEAIGLQMPSGETLLLSPPSIPELPSGPEFPHRIESGSSSAWPVDSMRLLTWVAGPARYVRGPVRAVALLGNGHRATSKPGMQIGPRADHDRRWRRPSAWRSWLRNCTSPY
jgi:hypothetical protein